MHRFNFRVLFFFLLVINFTHIVNSQSRVFKIPNGQIIERGGAFIIFGLEKVRGNRKLYIQTLGPDLSLIADFTQLISKKSRHFTRIAEAPDGYEIWFKNNFVLLDTTLTQLSYFEAKEHLRSIDWTANKSTRESYFTHSNEIFYSSDLAYEIKDDYLPHSYSVLDSYRDIYFRELSQNKRKVLQKYNIEKELNLGNLNYRRGQLRFFDENHFLVNISVKDTMTGLEKELLYLINTETFEIDKRLIMNELFTGDTTCVFSNLFIDNEKNIFISGNYVSDINKDKEYVKKTDGWFLIKLDSTMEVKGLKTHKYRKVVGLNDEYSYGTATFKIVGGCSTIRHIMEVDNELIVIVEHMRISTAIKYEMMSSLSRNNYQTSAFSSFVLDKRLELKNSVVQIVPRDKELGKQEWIPYTGYCMSSYFPSNCLTDLFFDSEHGQMIFETHPSTGPKKNSKYYSWVFHGPKKGEYRLLTEEGDEEVGSQYFVKKPFVAYRFSSNNNESKIIIKRF